MLIDCADPSTYPVAIKKAVQRYIENNLAAVKGQLEQTAISNNNGIACAIELYLSPLRAGMLYQELLDTMADKEFMLFHATKMMDPGHIQTAGLKTNSWDHYNKTMEKALCDLNCPNVRGVLDCVYREYKRKYTDHRQKPQLCFFSAEKLMDGGCMAGYDQFCQNIGGELARWALKSKMPAAYQLLKNNGVKLLVKFKLPFHDITAHQREGILYQFVQHYAALYYWNWNYEPRFDGTTNCDVPPEQILEVIEYKKEVDYE